MGKIYCLHVSPNPFNPNLNITISSSKIIPEAVKIFDISGKLVADLSSQINATGIINWHASSKRSGVFWVWVKTANKTLVKQVTLVK